MDPVNARHTVAAVPKRTLAFWAAAFAVGAYLGYKMAEGLASSGLAMFGVIAGGLIVAVILAILAVIAGMAALEPDKRGRPMARAMIVAGVLLIAGVGAGWVIETLGLGPGPAVYLEASGSMTVSLDGIDGYAGQDDALAHCRSGSDATTVAHVEANGVGMVGTGAVGAAVLILPEFSEDRPTVSVSIVPADKTEGGAPTWQGSLGAVERIDGDRSGRIAFSGAILTANEETGLPSEGWPAELSGTISWSCDAWLPGASPQP